MKKIILIFSLLTFAISSFARPTVNPVKLATNGMDNPVAVTNINFGWKLNASANAASQTAYEIWVGKSSSCSGDVWKSGKVVSEDQFGIVPDVKFEEGCQYFWKVRVWDAADQVSKWSTVASFTVGIDNSWAAEWIASGKKDGGPLPIFRKEVKLDKGKVKRAVIYLSGLGCSELFFNGAAVDPDRMLDPAQTDYNVRALYSAFDVTSLLKTDNCIGVMLGDGWYNQGKVWDKGMAYGTPILRCQMNVEYTNGKKEVIGTDTSWKWTDGPLLSSNVYKGDEYDARLEIEGWCESGLDDSAWKPAVKAEGVIPQRMQAQELPPMRALEPVKAVNMWRSPKGGNVWVYDFGRNMTSVIRFSAELPAGVRLQSRGAEELTPEKDLDYSSTGIEHIGYQQDAYTFAGKGFETWRPDFTYHGMRYVELTVEGTDKEPTLDWISAVPCRTDVEVTGSFECSDSQLNALHQLAVNTFLNAFVGLPVDCNQREKCGWLGDTHAYDKSANLNFQMNNFWVKYLDDIRTSSDVTLKNTLHHRLYNSTFYFTDKPAGIPFMIAPGRRLCGVASPDWGTAVVQLPWHLYLYYGNKQILEDYYDMMDLWVRHIDETAIDGIVYQGLGDWCPMEGNHIHNETPVEFSSTAFHALDLSIMVQVAKVLGQKEDLTWYSERLAATRKAMAARYYNPVKISYGANTAGVMALELGLFPEDVREQGAKEICWDARQSSHNFMNVGIFGLCRIGSQLARNGCASEVFDMFTKKGEHSFGVMIDSLHVTTLWESLPLDSDTAWGPHGSHNHPMQGGYDSWLYEDVAGIRPCECAPGFKTVVFEPQHIADLDWAKGSVETPYGTTSSFWKKTDSALEWTVTIPAGSNGLVLLPEDKTVTVDGKAIEFDVKACGGKNFRVFPSGTYQIVVE